MNTQHVASMGLISLLSIALAACSAMGPDSGHEDGAHPDGGHAADGASDGGHPSGDSSTMPAAAAHFASTPINEPASAATIDYPLDGVLFPRNVYAPTVQWEGPGVAGDIYRVQLTGTSGTNVTAYVTHTGSGFTFSTDTDPVAWQGFTTLNVGQETLLTVDRWIESRNVVVAGTPVHVRLANGSIAGAVYYWTLGHFAGTEGRIQRIEQGTDSAPHPISFFPNPPPRPRDGAQCSACHGLSRNGNRMAVALGDDEFGGVYDLTTDLTGPNPPAIFLLRQSWYFSAFNPDSSRLLMNDQNQAMHLLDGNTGAEIAPAAGSLPSGTHPAWSPDGATVAHIANANDPWNVTQGDLAIQTVSSGDQFGASTTIHSGASLSSAPEGGVADAYPSFSPDSRLIAFQHGTGVWIHSGADTTGALYVVQSHGGPTLRLTRASTGSSPGDAYYPNFTPFETPGFTSAQVYWLLFYTQRDYGNAQAGTKGSHRRQIWVTSVSTDLSGSGGDPSTVPYWLPGQDVAQENASADWSPLACRSNGLRCSDNGQCCSTNCVPDVDGNQTCAPPPPSGCRSEGQSCGATADCCNATLQCAGGVCVPTPP